MRSPRANLTTSLSRPSWTTPSPFSTDSSPVVRKHSTHEPVLEKRTGFFRCHIRQRLIDCLIARMHLVSRLRNRLPQGCRCEECVSTPSASRRMCMRRYLLPALAVSGLILGTAIAADSDGLKVGDSVAAFNVKDVTGPNAGKSLCYRCQYG